VLSPVCIRVCVVLCPVSLCVHLPITCITCMRACIHIHTHTYTYDVDAHIHTYIHRSVRPLLHPFKCVCACMHTYTQDVTASTLSLSLSLTHTHHTHKQYSQACLSESGVVAHALACVHPNAEESQCRINARACVNKRRVLGP
jgi:hypothetical protein